MAENRGFDGEPSTTMENYEVMTESYDAKTTVIIKWDCTTADPNATSFCSVCVKGRLYKKINGQWVLEDSTEGVWSSNGPCGSTGNSFTYTLTSHVYEGTDWKVEIDLGDTSTMDCDALYTAYDYFSYP